MTIFIFNTKYKVRINIMEFNLFIICLLHLCTFFIYLLICISVNRPWYIIVPISTQSAVLLVTNTHVTFIGLIWKMVSGKQYMFVLEKKSQSLMVDTGMSLPLMARWFMSWVVAPRQRPMAFRWVNKYIQISYADFMLS